MGLFMTLTDKFDDDPALVERFNGQSPKEEGSHKVVQLVITYEGKRIPVAVFSDVIRTEQDKEKITHGATLRRYLEEKKIPYRITYSEVRSGVAIPERTGGDKNIHYTMIGAGYCLNSHAETPEGIKEELMFTNVKSLDYDVGLKRAHLLALQKRHKDWIIGQAITD